MRKIKLKCRKRKTVCCKITEKADRIIPNHQRFANWTYVLIPSHRKKSLRMHSIVYTTRVAYGKP